MERPLINLEIIRVAREIVMNEHADLRAELHNNWLYKSDVLWRKEKKRLAYPTIPPYPTENDIVERAKVLIDFMINYDPKPKEPVIESVEGSPIDVPENVVLPFKKPPIETPSEPPLKLVEEETKEEAKEETKEEAKEEIVESDTSTESPTEPPQELPIQTTKRSVKFPIRNVELLETLLQQKLQEFKQNTSKAPTVDTNIDGKILPGVRKKIEDIRSDTTNK